MEEFAFIDWIRGQTRLDPSRVPVGPGDDCAVVRVGGESLLVTTDPCADGVHFRLAECGPRAAAAKVMKRNLSDIAAMGGEPIAAVAAVTLPRGFAEADAKELYLGLREAGDAFDCPVVGGDVSAWDHPLLLTVTMFGRPAGERPILRSDARPGDAICVTGTLGGTLASGHHLRFTPRVREAAALVRGFDVHAMIDLSDGLASDLRHVCRESGVAAELDAAAVPVSPAAAGTADPLAAALTDGEDYELLFTLAADAAADLEARQPLGVPVRRIGRIVAGEGITLVRPGGRREPLTASGWRHRI